jgi:hypothetical protein
MPAHLSSVSRRTFLTHLGGVGVFGSVIRAAATRSVDPDRIAILNDTHIGKNHPSNSPIPTHLRETVA